jgi:hypothetical protein
MYEVYVLIGVVALCFIALIGVVIYTNKGDNEVYANDINSYSVPTLPTSTTYIAPQVQRVIPGYTDPYLYSDFGLDQRGRDEQRMRR